MCLLYIEYSQRYILASCLTHIQVNIFFATVCGFRRASLDKCAFSFDRLIVDNYEEQNRLELEPDFFLLIEFIS